MPLPGENVEVVFAGLDQKTASPLTAPGELETADNIEFDKSGQLNKRRGYQDIESDTAADGDTMPAVFHRVVVGERDEVLVISDASCWSLEAQSERLQTGPRGFVDRGPAIVGGVSVVEVYTSPDSEDF